MSLILELLENEIHDNTAKYTNVECRVLQLARDIIHDRDIAEAQFSAEQQPIVEVSDPVLSQIAQREGAPFASARTGETLATNEFVILQETKLRERLDAADEEYLDVTKRATLRQQTIERGAQMLRNNAEYAKLLERLNNRGFALEDYINKKLLSPEVAAQRTETEQRDCEHHAGLLRQYMWDGASDSEIDSRISDEVRQQFNEILADFTPPNTGETYQGFTLRQNIDPAVMAANSVQDRMPQSMTHSALFWHDPEEEIRVADELERDMIAAERNREKQLE